MRHRRVGLIVNPIAGIGGRVGLKGSDGLEIQRRAHELGALPAAGDRTARALVPLQPIASHLELITAPHVMGELVARRCGFNVRSLPVNEYSTGDTTVDDTSRAASEMKTADVDLILFAGGDGTARDIYEAVGNEFPVLGIPAGVKIYSAVFGVSPEKTGELARAFLQNDRFQLQEAEVIDLDESAYREGHINTRLFGFLKIPYRRRHTQNQKTPSPDGDLVQAQAIAADVIDRMQSDQAYILGPGTTTRAISQSLGLPKTLVGVDIITKDGIIELDVGEQRILELMDQRSAKIIITPTGGQGFLFGRGNQQLSAEVIGRVGRENIIVISRLSKIADLENSPLLVDTDDHKTDRLLAGHVEIITGYHEKIIYRIEACGGA